MRDKPLSGYLMAAGHSEIVTRSSNAVLDHFVGSIADCLDGSMPDEARETAVSEMLDWLENRIEGKVYEGLNYQTATAETLAENVSPQFVADQILEDYYERAVDSPIFNHFGRANVIAYAFYSCMTVIYLAFLQLVIFLPSEQRLNLPDSFSPARLREYFPAPLPYPDLTPQFFFMIGYPFLAPILAGWLSGKFIPVRPHTAIYNAFLPLLLLNYLAAAALWPATEPMLYSVIQTIFGLPVGYAVAYFTNKRTRNHHLRAHASGKFTHGE